MLYTVLLCLIVLFSLVGLVTVCYCVMLLFIKPKRKHKSIILLPMCENEHDNAGRIGYAVERVNLFGEDKNVEIWAVSGDGENHDDIKKMFERCNSVRFAHIGDMPFLLSEFKSEDRCR